jgi:hypothetical protein
VGEKRPFSEVDSLEKAITDIDWVALHTKVRNGSVGFGVQLQVFTKNYQLDFEWTKSSEDTTRLSMGMDEETDESDDCVVMILYSTVRVLHVVNLFDIRRKGANCKMTPQYFDNTVRGYGSAVLNFATYVASALGFMLRLLDNAKWVEKPPHAFGDLISLHLELDRGFGYYHARGFVPKQLFDALAIDGRLTKLEYTDAMHFELSWVHMLCTTPVDELEDSIRAFRTLIPERLQTHWRSGFLDEHTSLHWVKVVVDKLGAIDNGEHTVRPGKELKAMSFREIFQNREALMNSKPKLDPQEVEFAYEECRRLPYKNVVEKITLVKTTFVHENGTYAELLPQKVEGTYTAMPHVTEHPVGTDIFVNVLSPP